ncbi:MAG: UvrB/UvrC motif-containing protein [Clostridia bacterium]|nr:UvrB/UvrC motif-containing protein [Clostridia bacterium]
MFCDKCGRPSVYRSTLIVNGVSQNTNLCRDCAIQEGVFSSQTSVFDDMFSIFSDFLPFEKVSNVSCPVCKLTMREFKNSGKLGCPNCYEAFREEISKIIKRIAPNERHKQESISKPKKTENKAQKISSLREEMRVAVAEERYEDAAKIKKQIQKLESKDE